MVGEPHSADLLGINLHSSFRPWMKIIPKEMWVRYCSFHYVCIGKEEIMQLSWNPLGVMTHLRSHGPNVWSVSTYTDCAEIAAVALQQWLTCDALLNSLFKVRWSANWQSSNTNICLYPKFWKYVNSTRI